MPDDLVVRAVSALVPGGVRRGELAQGSRWLRWVEAGSGSPAVVFDAPGGEPGSLAWAGVIPSVAARARVVAYDRAGTGASDPVPSLTLDGQAGDLEAVIRAAGPGPCIVVGHSWGGILAQLVALACPELAAGLVLADPAEKPTLRRSRTPGSGSGSGRPC